MDDLSYNISYQNQGDDMKRIIIAAMIGSSLFISGCTWKKIPEAPAYKSGQNIPIRVGVSFKDDAAYGNKIVAELRKSNFFSETVYPYRADDKLDAVLDLYLSGKWDMNSAKNIGSAVLNGATLGVSGSMIGSSMDGHHNLTATLFKNGKAVKVYEANATNTVEFGMYSNKSQVIAESNSLQIKTLSAGLMNSMYADRNDILKSVTMDK